MVNVGKYTVRPMDPMGVKVVGDPGPLTFTPEDKLFAPRPQGLETFLPSEKPSIFQGGVTKLHGWS